MLSFLIDDLAVLDAYAPASLSQGNAGPIAVNDMLSLSGDAGPVTIAVMANDIDPEGQPLTLISAVAALGDAVANPDGTVTYTPPAGIPPGTVEFDTVAYDIEDAEGARDTGQIDIAITEPDVVITTLTDNTFEVSTGTGAADVAITSPSALAGSYAADLDGLADGPVNLIRPGISGALVPGGVLTAVDGLWCHDAGGGAPVRARQWQRGGGDIPGETGASYTVSAGDDSAGIGLIETLTDAFGTTSAADTPGMTTFLPSDDALLIGWWDAAESATITENGGAVSAWAARNGAPALVQTNTARQPATGTRSLGGLNVLDFDGGDHLQQDIQLPASGNVAFHMVLAINGFDNAFSAILATEATNDFQLDANADAGFAGRFNAAGIGTTVGLSGGPFAGAMRLSIVCDLTGAGEIEILIDGVSRGIVAYTTALDATTALHVMTNRSKNAWVAGAVAEFVISGDVANAGDYHDYLSQKWGLI